MKNKVTIPIPTSVNKFKIERGIKKLAELNIDAEMDGAIMVLQIPKQNTKALDLSIAFQAGMILAGSFAML